MRVPSLRSISWMAAFTLGSICIVDAVQVFGGIVFDLNLAASLGAFLDVDAGTQFALHFLDGRFHIGIDLDFIDVLGRLAGRHFGAGLFDLADRPTVVDGAFGDLPLQVGVGQAEQAASVNGGK